MGKGVMAMIMPWKRREGRPKGLSGDDRATRRRMTSQKHRPPHKSGNDAADGDDYQIGFLTGGLPKPQVPISINYFHLGSAQTANMNSNL